MMQENSFCIFTSTGVSSTVAQGCLGDFSHASGYIKPLNDSRRVTSIWESVGESSIDLMLNTARTSIVYQLHAERPFLTLAVAPAWIATYNRSCKSMHWLKMMKKLSLDSKSCDSAVRLPSEFSSFLLLALFPVTHDSHIMLICLVLQ